MFCRHAVVQHGTATAYRRGRSYLSKRMNQFFYTWFFESKSIGVFFDWNVLMHDLLSQPSMVERSRSELGYAVLVEPDGSEMPYFPRKH